MLIKREKNKVNFFLFFYQHYEISQNIYIYMYIKKILLVVHSIYIQYIYKQYIVVYTQYAQAYFGIFMC